MTSAQPRVAQAIVNMSQQQLAATARAGLSKVRKFEARPWASIANNSAAIWSALKAVGVIFVKENDEEPGVRLKRAL